MCGVAGAATSEATDMTGLGDKARKVPTSPSSSSSSSPPPSAAGTATAGVTVESLLADVRLCLALSFIVM
jgi:hypothetical protein